VRGSLGHGGRPNVGVIDIWPETGRRSGSGAWHRCGTTRGQRAGHGTASSPGSRVLPVPAGDGMRAASEAGVASPRLNELLRSGPDHVGDLVRMLEAADGIHPRLALRSLQDDRDGTGHAVLTTVVAGGYRIDPGIRRRLGYPGQQAVAISEPSLDDEDEALLASVIRREPIFRS
jgi:hypothetical protein